VRTTAASHVRQPELLESLYQTHALWAVRLAYVLTGNRDLANDLTHEAFIRTFERLDALRETTAFPSYLRTTILNLARAHFRRRRLELFSLRRTASLARVEPTSTPSLDERDRLWRVLSTLPYRQRAALVLRYYEDLSERDAAAALRVTLPALKALITRGTRTLRNQLRESEGGTDV
jgi:RNA polymerase sigma factor (sigma-70 family)